VAAVAVLTTTIPTPTGVMVVVEEEEDGLVALPQPLAALRRHQVRDSLEATVAVMGHLM